MKIYTRVSDSGFHGKINVVSPGDSAKRANASRRAGFCPCKREVKSALFVGLALPRELTLLHVNNP